MARQSSDQMIKRSDGQMIKWLDDWMAKLSDFQIQLDGQMVE